MTILTPVHPELLSADTLAEIEKGIAMEDAYFRMLAAPARDDQAYRNARDDFERAKAR